jgi:hypothetical protein
MINCYAVLPAVEQTVLINYNTLSYPDLPKIQKAHVHHNNSRRMNVIIKQPKKPFAQKMDWNMADNIIIQVSKQ